MNRLYLFIISLFLTSPLLAQTFYGGVLGGFNASQVEGDLARGYNKLGANLGTWIQADLMNNFYWGMELKFSQKGSYIRPTKLNSYWKYSYQLNYIDLPVLIGYQYASAISAFTGISFNYLISSSGYNNFGPDPTVEFQNIASWEVGTLLGIKVDFDQLVQADWARKVALDVRFQYSMLSVRPPHRFFIGNFYYGQYNNFISTTLYYRIDFKK